MLRAWVIFVLITKGVLGATKTTVPATSFSSTSGPTLDAWSYVWRKVYTPVIIGTVLVAVNEATNQTSRTTLYHSEYLSGTEKVPTPTDLNAAGTRTAFIGATHLTYPGNFYTLASELSWTAIFPLTSTGTYSKPHANSEFILGDLGKDGTCCYPSWTRSPTPSHSPLKQSSQPIDDADPRGLLYDLIVPGTQLTGDQVLALFSPTPLTLPYYGCEHAMCTNVSGAAWAGASVVGTVMGIFATRSTTISVNDDDDTEVFHSSTLLSPIASVSLPPSTVGSGSLTGIPHIKSTSMAPDARTASESGRTTPLATTHTADTSTSRSSLLTHQDTSDGSKESDSTSTTTIHITRTSTRISYTTIDADIADGTTTEAGPTSDSNGTPNNGEHEWQDSSVTLHTTISQSLVRATSQTSPTALVSTTTGQETDSSSDLRSNIITAPSSTISFMATKISIQIQTYTSERPAAQTNPSSIGAAISISDIPSPAPEHINSSQTSELPKAYPSAERTSMVSPIDNHTSFITPTGLDTLSLTSADSLGSRATTLQGLQSSSSTIDIGQLIGQGLAPSTSVAAPATIRHTLIVKSSSANTLFRMRAFERALNWVLSLWW